jgi:uncharacterized protein
MNLPQSRHGESIWYELLTKDLGNAQAFYSGLIGWNVVDAGMPGMDYHLAMQGDAAIGGIMPITDEMAAGGAMPVWLPYFGVDDVDAAVEMAVAGGAEVQLPAFDVSEVGRMAMLMHEHVGMFYVMRGAPPEPSKSFAARAPKVGHVAWNELASSDPAVAKAFLSDVFGFAKSGGMDMGPLGEYEFLSIAGGAFAVGAVMPLMAGMPGSMWTTYFRVADIDVGAAFVTANGGQVVAGPMEIPDGEYSFNAIDPDGAMFGCVGPRVMAEG